MKPEELAEIEALLEKEGPGALSEGTRTPSGEIPEDVDRRIRSFIAGRAAEIRREGRPRFAMLRPALAAAAALVLAVGGLLVFRGGERAAAGDLDRDGRVDIVDAYLLDRALRRGEVPGNGDLNGDGRVDRQDVTAAARRAVALEPGEGA